MGFPVGMKFSHTKFYQDKYPFRLMLLQSTPVFAPFLREVKETRKYFVSPIEKVKRSCFKNLIFYEFIS